MGKRGPAPDPVGLRLLKGETRPSRTNPQAPEPPAGDRAPDPPKWLGRHARATWRRLAPTLWPVRLLTDWDLDAFAAYCAAVGFVREAIELASSEGIVLEQLTAVRKGRDGEDDELLTQRVTAPAFRAYRDAVATMRGLAGEFGLTPSARATIKLDGPKIDPRSSARELLS